MQPSMPTNFGSYLIRDKIGSGGMATVYRAFDPGRNQDVALKVLSIHLTNSENIIKRFKREAEALRQLEHPHILPIYDYNGDSDPPYIVMKLMSGQSLASLLESGQPLDPALVSRYTYQIASALDYAHARHVIHRDIKPSNILLDLNGIPFLSDFGVAYVEDGGTRLTSDGGFVGTVSYASPEQCRGEMPTAASDIYSLGVLVFQMLTGRQPFEGPTPLVVMRSHLSDPPPNPISFNPSLPMALYTVLAKALAKLPPNRYTTALKFSEAIDESLNLPPRQGGLLTDDPTWLLGQTPTPDQTDVTSKPVIRRIDPKTVVAPEAPPTQSIPVPKSQVEWVQPAGALVVASAAPEWFKDDIEFDEDSFPDEHGTVVAEDIPPEWLEGDEDEAALPFPGPKHFSHIKMMVPAGAPMGKTGLYFIIVVSLALLGVAAVIGYRKWNPTAEAESIELDATYRDLGFSVDYPDGWTAQTASTALFPGSSEAIIVSDQRVPAAGPYGTADLVILIQPIDAAQVFAVSSLCAIGDGPERVFACMDEQGFGPPRHESVGDTGGVLLRGTLPPMSTTWPMILLPRNESSWLALIVVQWDGYTDAYEVLELIAASVRN